MAFFNFVTATAQQALCNKLADCSHKLIVNLR